MPIINAPSGPTVGQLLDQITRLLYGNRRLELNRLAAAVDDVDTDTTITATYTHTWSRGDRIEIGRELLYIWSADHVAKTAVCSRGNEDDTPREHAIGDIIRVNPVWTRQTLYEALLEEVRSLNGTGLFGATTVDVAVTTDGLGTVPDVGSQILGCYGLSFAGTGVLPVSPRYRFHPRQDDDGGATLALVSDVGRGETVRATFTLAFADFTAEGDGLDEVCHVPDHALDVLKFGVAARVYPHQEGARIDLVAAAGARNPDDVPVTSAMRVAEQYRTMQERALGRALGRQQKLYPLVART